MFESIIAKEVKPSSVTWSHPEYIDIELDNDENPRTSYHLLKGAQTFLHKQIDLRPSTSKEVYKKSKSIWENLKNTLLDEIKDSMDTRGSFELAKENIIYLVNDNNQVIDVFDALDDDRENEFKDKLNRFNLDITTTEKTKKFFTDGKGGLVKLVCYDRNWDVTTEAYTPVVLIEMNNDKAEYKVYTGILVYNTFTFIPSISTFFDADSLSRFISGIDIDNALQYATDRGEELFNDYQNFKLNPIEISARELISVLKKVGYKLELKDDNQLDEITNLSDEKANMQIQQFFNTFTLKTGETAYDILSLSELKKIFRYNKLTIFDILCILSKEYLTYDGSKIDCDVLGSIVYNLYDKGNDKRQVEAIKQEVADE